MHSAYIILVLLLLGPTAWANADTIAGVPTPVETGGKAFIDASNERHARSELSDEMCIMQGWLRVSHASNLESVVQNAVQDSTRVQDKEIAILEKTVLKRAEELQQNNDQLRINLEELRRSNEMMHEKFRQQEIHNLAYGLLSSALVDQPAGALAPGLEVTPVEIEKGNKNAGVYLLFIIVYAFCCLCYEVEQSYKIADTSKPTRHIEWDILRLVLIACVIKFHLWQRVVQEVTPGGDSMRRFSYFGASFAMCGFTFISGTFGRNLSWMSFARTVCCTLGTSFLFAICLSIIRYGFPDASFRLYSETWYLQALLTFRVIFIPVLLLSGPVRVLACVTSFVATYFALTVFLKVDSEPPMLTKQTGFLTGLPFYAIILPFYALGMLRAPDHWLEQAKSTFSGLACLAFVAAWYACLAFSSGFREWADVECWDGGQCDNFTYPISLQNMKNVSLESAAIFLRIYIQKLLITLAMLATLINAASCLQGLLPKCAQILANFGTRTLHAYLLHWLMFVCLGAETGFYSRTSDSMHWWDFDVFMVFYWLLTCFVCTCKLTGYLFAWMFQPFWLLDIAFCAKERASASTAVLFISHQKEEDKQVAS